MSQRCRDRGHQNAGQFVRAGDHMDRYAKGTGSQDLAEGCLAAAVLAEDRGDAFAAQQSAFVAFRKRAACQQIGDVRQVQGRVDGIDGTHDIAVLRGEAQGADFLAAKGDKDHLSGAAKRADGRFSIGTFDPAVAGLFVPARTMQGQQRNAGRLRGNDSVTRNLVSVRVGGVDQQADVLGLQIGSKPLRAPKTAGAYRHGLARRIGGAARQRQDDGPMGEALRQLAGLGRAPQDQDVCHG